jgi:chloramphenicol-sensitive protein RarD
MADLQERFSALANGCTSRHRCRMTDMMRGLVALVVTCTIWGLSPIYYKQLAHVPPDLVLAHRAGWSFVLFAIVLGLQGRLGQVRAAFSNARQAAIIALAAAMISTNWFVFIYSVQVGRATEASIGYYIFPLVSVLIGWLWFGERLGRQKWLAVGLAAMGVLILTWGLGVTPWVSLILAGSFGMYGGIKKHISLGPVLSVTCEILVFMPVAVVIFALAARNGEPLAGDGLQDLVLLMLAGPITATPLIMFSYAAKRVTMAVAGLTQYLNPTLQFLCAVAVFGEPFTVWHGLCFAFIWGALALFSIAGLKRSKG